MNNHNQYLKLLITSLLISLVKNELRIPFKTEKYLNISSNISSIEELKIYILNLIRNNIYIELNIGSPSPQIIKSFLKLEEYPFFIQGKDIPSTLYNQEKSLTYKSELYPHVFLDGEEQIKWGYVSNDTIEIKSKSKNIEIKQFNFVLVTETKSESPSNKGLMVPIKYSSIQDISFINQLKKQEIIDYYDFVFIIHHMIKGKENL